MAEPADHDQSRGVPPGLGPRLLKRGVSVLPNMLRRVAALSGAPLKLVAWSEPAPPALGTMGSAHQDEEGPNRQGMKLPRSQELDRAQHGGARPTGCEVEEDSRMGRRRQAGEQLPLPQSDGNKEQAAAQERASRATGWWPSQMCWSCSGSRNENIRGIWWIREASV